MRLDESHMLVKSGRFVTAGAALSHMDLALWLIRQHSPKLADVTAKYLSLHAVLGKSPLSYFQSLRVERAVHLLKTGNESVEEIAARVGYADGVTLRTLLRRRRVRSGIRRAS